MKKILIVEDEISYVRLLSDQLSAKGYQILEAHDGKTGLELAIKEHPDLILLDIKMPVMDGMTMLDRLRQETTGKNTKVIMLTNLEPTGKIIDNAIKDQLTYYFVKSDTKIMDLLEKIKTLLAD
jgi:DNA-binding response OmpR family regulator